MLAISSGNKKVGKKGLTLIEILIVITIIVVVLTSLLGLATFSLKISTQIKESTQAVYLAREAIEATRSIRDSNWAKLTNGSHGLTNTDGYWDFLGTENIINGFNRTILIESVSRNPTTNDIETTYNPANDDSNTKKVTVTIFWSNKEVKIITYLTNWQ